MNPNLQPEYYGCSDGNGWAVLFHSMYMNFTWCGCGVPIRLWSIWMDGNHIHSLDGKGAMS